MSPSLHTDVVETAVCRTVTFREGLERAPDDQREQKHESEQPAHDLEEARVFFHADRGPQYAEARSG